MRLMRRTNTRYRWVDLAEVSAYPSTFATVTDKDGKQVRRGQIQLAGGVNYQYYLHFDLEEAKRLAAHLAKAIEREERRLLHGEIPTEETT